MRCPECGETFEILESRLYDFTDSSLGCKKTGHFPEHTSRVVLDNIEMLRCACGDAPNVPHLGRLQTLLFGEDGSNPNIDPYSGAIYMSTWDDDDEIWILSRHAEQ